MLSKPSEQELLTAAAMAERLRRANETPEEAAARQAAQLKKKGTVKKQAKGAHPLSALKRKREDPSAPTRSVRPAPRSLKELVVQVDDELAATANRALPLSQKTPLVAKPRISHEPKQAEKKQRIRTPRSAKRIPKKRGSRGGKRTKTKWREEKRRRKQEALEKETSDGSSVEKKVQKKSFFVEKKVQKKSFLVEEKKPFDKKK